MIANSGHDEHGRYVGGKAGDQTGREFEVRQWYSRPWSCVLRHPERRVGEKLAQLARAAALNDHIGYDQGQRWSFLAALRLANWQPGLIAVDCEADCSSGVISLVMGVGYLLNIDSLKKINSSATYTGNMRVAFRTAGYQVLTDHRYTTSTRYLLPGDILLNDASHVAINLDTGVSAVTSTIAAQKGALNTAPKWIGEVTASSLSVRTWAGVGNPTIKSWPALAKGNWVDICDTVSDANGTPWYYVRIYGKYYGFVHSGYIRKVM